MLDNLYENIGGKIKTLAKWSFVVEAVGAILSGLVLMTTNEYLVATGLLTMIVGPVVAWVASWILYGFGTLVDDTHAMRQKDCPLPTPTTTATTPAPATIRQESTTVKSGNCQLCGNYSEKLVYCQIQDDLGIRFRALCPDCIAQQNATPSK